MHMSPIIPTWSYFLTWISNYIYYKVGPEITYPFPNFKDAAVEVWEWMIDLMTPCDIA